MTKIVTMVRLKPLLCNKNTSFHVEINTQDDELIVNEKKKTYDLSEVNKQHVFNFDKIYNSKSLTDDIFNDIGIQLVDDFLKKINSTFYVFGQTGSGKTHTIMGNDKIYGFVKILLHYLNDMKKETKVSVIEIYNDVCYDILNLSNVIYQREDRYGNIFLRGIVTEKLSTKQDIGRIFKTINKNRKVGLSSQNNASSRSHLQIKLELENGTFIKIIDLAGSERASQSNFINRKVYRENAEINKSLLVLKECIRGIKEKSSHIPIRSSKLTRLLKDSLNGKCNTYILGTIAQEQKNITDSMSTLNYMTDIKHMKKIEMKKLPVIKENPHILIKSKSEDIVGNVNRQKALYDNFSLSPNYKFIIRNKYILEDNNKSQEIILKKIYKERSTKQLKSDLLDIMDKQIDFINKIKDNIK